MVATSLATAQMSHGKEVRVFSLLGSGPLAGSLEQLGIGVYVCRHNPLLSSAGKLGSLLELRRELRRWRADIVHCHNITATLYGAVSARLAGIRGVVATRHGFLVTPKLVRK